MSGVRFDASLRESLRRNVEAHERTTVEDAALRHAAVAVAVVADEAGEACFLLTRRTSRMRAHSSQWALPGGRVDEGERVEDAVRRELFEEVAVADVDVVGLLDDYATRSGYRITPVVVWADRTDGMDANPDEVEAVYRVPLDELLREDSPRFADIPEIDGPLLQVPIRDRLVHAPTGAVLYQFREVALLGRSTRVAHFDQPPFAWR